MDERNLRVPAPIKVIGVGGGGCNAVRRMLKKPTPGVQYIVCNTDIKSLDSCPTDILSVQIGEHLTRGFGAGGDMRVGEKAAEEGRFLLKRALKDAELVFITAGMGGGTACTWRDAFGGPPTPERDSRRSGGTPGVPGAFW